MVAWNIPHFLGKHIWEDTDVLVVLHGHAKVEVFDVDAEVSGTFLGIVDGAIYVELGIKHANGGGSVIARVVQAVATGSHVDMMGFRLVRADIADIVGIGYFSVGRNILFFHEEDSACAGDTF